MCSFHQCCEFILQYSQCIHVVLQNVTRWISLLQQFIVCVKNGMHMFNANLWFILGDIFCIKINTLPGICSLKLTASLAYAYCKRTCMQTGRGFPTMVWTIILHFRFCIVLINVWLRKYLIVKLVSVFPTFNNNMVKSSSRSRSFLQVQIYR